VPGSLGSWRCGPTSRKRCRMGRIRYCVVGSYQPMSLAELAPFIAAEPEFDTRWRLVIEFMKEYHLEPAGTRQRLLADAPGLAMSAGTCFWRGLPSTLPCETARTRRGGRHLAGCGDSGSRSTRQARAPRRSCMPRRVPQAGRVRCRLRDRRRVSDPSPLLDRAGIEEASAALAWLRRWWAPSRRTPAR
jgi:hypothetical protein